MSSLARLTCQHMTTRLPPAAAQFIDDDPIASGEAPMETMIVTGGAGFIGANFVRLALAQTEARVVVVDALTYAGQMWSGPLSCLRRPVPISSSSTAPPVPAFASSRCPPTRSLGP